MLRKTVIRLPANATVFVLEDSATRLEWFDERLGRVNVRYSSTVEDALEKLIDLDRDAFLFLDHDLNWMDAGGRKPGSGVRVSHFVSKNGFTGRIVIHSVNEQGAAEMKKWLPKAAVHPFGSFDVEVS